MALHSPWLLLVALLGFLPFLFYLSRYVRAEKKTFPAALLVFEKDRKPLRRLRGRQLVIAVLQGVFLAFLALAFARPSVLKDGDFPWQAQVPRTLIIVDTGRETIALVDGRTLLDEAQARLRQDLSLDPSEAQYALLSCPADPGKPLEWGDAAELLGQVDNLVSGPGHCKPRMLLESSKMALKQGDGVRIYSVQPPGDMAADSSRSGDAGILQKWTALGPADPNLALVDVKEDVDRDAIEVILENQSEFPVVTELDCRCSHSARAIPVNVPPMALTRVALGSPDEFGEGSCSLLLPPDGFGGDNLWWFAISQASAPTLLLVDGSRNQPAGEGAAQHLKDALRSGGWEGRILQMGPSEFSLEFLASTDLLVLVDPLPLPGYLLRGIRDYLSAGGHVWLLAGPNMEAWPRDNELLPGVEIRGCSSVAEHPFRIDWFLRKDPVFGLLADIEEEVIETWTHLRHEALLLPRLAVDVSSRFDDGAPFASVIKVGSGRLLIWSALPSADNGSMALHPLFPLIARKTLEAFLPSMPRLVLPQVCEIGAVCPVGDDQQDEEDLQEPGTQGPVEVTPGGEMLCSGVGVLAPKGLRGPGVRVLCRSSNPLRGQESSQQMEEPESVPVFPASDDEDALRADLALPALFVALLLLLAEAALVAGRYLPRRR